MGDLASCMGGLHGVMHTAMERSERSPDAPAYPLCGAAACHWPELPHLATASGFLPSCTILTH